MKVDKGEEVMQLVIPIVNLAFEEKEFLLFEESIHNINSGLKLSESGVKQFKELEASFKKFISGQGEKVKIKHL